MDTGLIGSFAHKWPHVCLSGQWRALTGRSWWIVSCATNEIGVSSVDGMLSHRRRSLISSDDTGSICFRETQTRARPAWERSTTDCSRESRCWLGRRSRSHKSMKTATAFLPYTVHAYSPLQWTVRHFFLWLSVSTDRQSKNPILKGSWHWAWECWRSHDSPANCDSMSYSI